VCPEIVLVSSSGERDGTFPVLDAIITYRPMIQNIGCARLLASPRFTEGMLASGASVSEPHVDKHVHEHQALRRRRSTSANQRDSVIRLRRTVVVNNSNLCSDRLS